MQNNSAIFRKSYCCLCIRTYRSGFTFLLMVKYLRYILISTFNMSSASVLPPKTRCSSCPFQYIYICPWDLKFIHIKTIICIHFHSTKCRFYWNCELRRVLLVYCFLLFPTACACTSLYDPIIFILLKHLWFLWLWALFIWQFGCIYWGGILYDVYFWVFLWLLPHLVFKFPWISLILSHDDVKFMSVSLLLGHVQYLFRCAHIGVSTVMYFTLKFVD